MLRLSFTSATAAISAAALFFFARPAHAQDISSTTAVDSGLREIDSKLTAPSTTSNGGVLRPSARIIGGTEDTSVQITLSTHSESRGPSTTDFSLTLTAPLDEDTGRGDFLTVDGLPSQWSVGAKVSFSIVDFDTINQRIGSRSQYLEKATQKCLVVERKPSVSEDELAAKCDLMESQVGDYLDAGDLSALNRDRQLVYEDLAKKSFLVINLSGDVGTQEFSYFDSTSLAESKVRKYSWSAGVWLGYLPQLKSPVFLVGGFEAKHGFKDAKKATYCPTGAVTPTVKCTTGAFGPPEKEIDYKLAAKARIRISGTIGIELTGAHDLHDDSWGLEMPVYFIMDKDGGLTGGIRAAYDSKEKDVQFGIFIGKTFDFLAL